MEIVRLSRKLAHIVWTEFETRSRFCFFVLRLCVILKAKYNNQ
jgi:hypothetical protein